MTLNALLKPVIPNLPPISLEREIETLRILPPETLFFALKDADAETALWVLENARPEQVQGVLDLDCWKGDEFLPERFFRYFDFITYTTPEKLLEYTKELDPEIIVLALMECIEVQDFDPQNPPEVEEPSMLLSPDNRYALIFKTPNPHLRDRLFHWLDKLSHMDIDLMRRHLESLKWENKNDLEEFGYQIKKGRVEELGFVEREEAIKFFSKIKAIDLKKHLLDHPLEKKAKEETPLVEILGSEDFLPQPISQAVTDEGFFRKALAKVEEAQLQDVIRMEVVRTLNGVFSAEDALSEEIEVLRDSASRTRQYLDLGLLFLSGGNLEAAAELLVRQPVFEVARLGWTLTQDLVSAAQSLKETYPLSIFEPLDRELLKALRGRHPDLQHPDLQRDLGSGSSDLNLENIHKIAEQLGALAVAGQFIMETLATSLKIKDEPLQVNESAWTRLATGIFRQSAGREFSPSPLNGQEWLDIKPTYNAESFEKLATLIRNKIPGAGQTHFYRRLHERQNEIQEALNRTLAPDPKYFTAVRMEN